MTSFRKATAAVAIAGVAMLGLAACGGGSEAAPSASPSIPATSMAVASSTPSALPMPGDDPATWAPVMIKKKTKAIELVPRQVAVWAALEYADNADFTAVSSDTSVVEVLPSDTGTVVGIRAVGPGQAVVKVYTTADATGKAFRKVKVTVTE